MTNKARNTSGKFAAKSDTPRKIRSVNLTDNAWLWLAAVAEEAGMSRNDYLEAMAKDSPFMETVSDALTTPEEALADAAIYGFTPEEALADAHFQINMLQANHDELEERHEALKRKLPLMETVQTQLEEARAEYAKLLESSGHIKASREKEIAELRSQLRQERADREQLETGLSDLREKSATAKDLPEAATILSQLRGKRKKSKADLADIEAILEILEGAL